MSAWRYWLPALLVLFSATTVSAQSRDIGVEQLKTGRAGENPLSLGSYHALVIGNQAYRHLRKLETPVADARAVADLLTQEYGFRVRLLENATRQEMLDALDDVLKTLGDDDNLLIYYAGHGDLDRGADRGYWLPVDAELNRRRYWLSNADVTDTLRALRAKHVVVVADSCYSGTLTRSSGVEQLAPPDILRLAQKKARTVLTSGGNEPVADTGGGAHSVFAKAFLGALQGNKGAADLTSLFGVIRRQVMLNAEQTPRYGDIKQSGHDGGDFIFFRPGAQIASAPPAPEPPPPTAREEIRRELGSLALNVSVDAVEVWVDDKRYEARRERALVIDNLPAGTYQVRAQKKGYKDWAQHIKVAANDRANVLIDLDPIAPIIREEMKRDLGSLALNVKIDGVEVWVDNERLGELRRGSVRVIEDLAAGTYRIRARKDGYREWVRHETVWANRRSEVVVDLEPIPERPPAPRDEPKKKGRDRDPIPPATTF